MIGRRAFLASSAVALLAPPLARAQRRLPVIGWLGTLNRTGELHSLFLSALQAHGFTEGRDFAAIERPLGTPDTFLDTARELVQLSPDLILTQNSDSVVAAAQATARIPIVAAVWDESVAIQLSGPVFSRPQSNVTGVLSSYPGQIVKRIELAAELIPGLKSIGKLIYPAARPQAQRTYRDVEVAATTLRLRFVPAMVNAVADFEPACRALLRDGVQIIDAPNALTDFDNPHLLAVTAAVGMATVWGDRRDVAIGGLASYGADGAARWPRVAAQVARILQGAKVADVPIELPPRFELAVNLATARSLGLNIPPAILARAEAVLE